MAYTGKFRVWRGDTDGGELDKDTVYDRAVGPMQFIPSTWAVVKVDADGDGEFELGQSALEADGPVVVICAHGIRARTAAEVLQTRGIDASILTGGLAQWQRA